MPMHGVHGSDMLHDHTKISYCKHDLYFVIILYEKWSQLLKKAH